jgi:hypothetical protein
VSGAGDRSLGVVIDGQPMPPSDARAFWERFSAYMEEHKGDLAGFAKQEGFASVHPSMKDGTAILLASRTSAQRPYAPVKERDGASAAPRHSRDHSAGGKNKKQSGRGGSSGHQGSSPDPSRGGGGRGKASKGRA